VATAQRSSGSPQLRALPRANRTEVRIHFAPPSSPVRTIAISSRNRRRRPTQQVAANEPYETGIAEKH